MVDNHTHTHTHTLLNITHQACMMKITENKLQIWREKTTSVDKWSLEILKLTLQQRPYVGTQLAVSKLIISVVAFIEATEATASVVS